MLNNGRCDLSSRLFLSITPKDPGQVFFGELIEQLGGSGLLSSVHAHVNGALQPKAEAPLS